MQLSKRKLYYVNTGGAKIIQKRAFYQCRYSLHTIDIPEVTEIAEGAFYCCFGQYNNCLRINAPQLKTIMRTGFRSCNLILVAPQLETIYAHSFDYCTIPEAIFPNLTTIVGKKVTTVSGNSPFSNCMVWALELPLLKEIECNFIINNGNNLQYINMPQFTGKLTQNFEYEFLNYCNISKETAQLSGLDYYDVNALGGSIRVTDAGMRFGFSFDENQTDNVEEYGFVYSASGVSSNALRTENTDAKNIFKLAANNRITHENNVTTFNLVLTDVPKSAYDFEISARAYVKIDGIYYYSDMLTRSFAQIAQAVLADETIDDATKEKVKVMLNA